MNCKKTERLLLFSFDRRLDGSEQAGLEAHLEKCPRCRRRKTEYASLIETLRREKPPDMKPYFWERLQPKLKEKRKTEPWTVWKQFGLKAIPLSLLMAILVAAGVILFAPSSPEIDLSQTGDFLLQNTNPLEETPLFLTEGGEANKHLMLIFSSLDEPEGLRRYFP